MRFERMRPAELRAAQAAGVPFVLPIGVMEYHGEHLPAGVDLLAVTETLARLGDAIVLLPPFAYGAASHAVAGPKGPAPSTSTRPPSSPWPRRCSPPSSRAAFATSTA